MDTIQRIATWMIVNQAIALPPIRILSSLTRVCRPLDRTKSKGTNCAKLNRFPAEIGEYQK